VGRVAIEWLDDIQAVLLQRATEFRDSNIIDVENADQFREVVGSGKWARAWWGGTDAQERALKEETGATLRCYPMDQPGGTGTCFLTGAEAKEIALFGRAY
jgi:prolyl-tRNA synthetase